MKNSNNHSFSRTIKLRIRILWVIVALMLAYMVIISELGGGDSRIMTPLAESVSRIIFFGGLIFVCYRIYFNKKLLENRLLLKEKFLDEQDERNQYLHDKSGGIVVDILMILLLFCTVTTALFNMVAFYVSLSVLTATVLLKWVSYMYYHRF
ncbi:MAG: hypothetical protein IJN46_04890 [Lachnospiraceae bacterium]|nr:hypothetical protein [Lachnospiraceae bacterium]